MEDAVGRVRSRRELPPGFGKGGVDHLGAGVGFRRPEQRRGLETMFERLLIVFFFERRVGRGLVRFSCKNAEFVLPGGRQPGAPHRLDHGQ